MLATTQHHTHDSDAILAFPLHERGDVVTTSVTLHFFLGKVVCALVGSLTYVPANVTYQNKEGSLWQTCRLGCQGRVFRDGHVREGLYAQPVNPLDCDSSCGGLFFNLAEITNAEDLLNVSHGERYIPLYISCDIYL